ncbi:hypothetical protein [Clostridium estertheticum]|uniref:hypothetical protein n=1 Tax=Clostridium estertheticum TaxID=238834 RepID=UPI00124E85F9|nr:hypothetical protein [Clostridium estertheticum]MBU3170201.1 hypothetical protein [Clostridium estertheticum]MBZ9617019.1 hypothetical protein [Clostridium estertheticum subsp. laramiense]WAG72720.1 hypothetical protein LL032_16400 [Clostridium estertheticum]
MDNQIEIILKMFELADTLFEGFDYVKSHIKEYESAIVIINDIKNGISSIQKSINEMSDELPFNEIDDLTVKMIKLIDEEVTDNYGIELGDKIIKNILPIYKELCIEIERCLKPYVLC